MLRLISKIFLVSVCLPYFLSLSVAAQSVSINVPNTVFEAMNRYRSRCTEHGEKLVLDGDEIVKLWTDEGEIAYVIRAAFTCGDLGHLWCGATGLCETLLVIGDELYNTNRLLSESPKRVSELQDGTIAYWLSDGVKLEAH